MFKRKANPFLNISLFIITAFLLFYVLYIWAGLIIPFIIALLFSFALIWLSWFYKKFRLPSFISFPLSLATYIFIFWLIGRMIWSNVADLNNLMPFYQEKILNMIVDFFDYLPASIETSLSNNLSSINFTKVFTTVLDTVTSIFSSTGIILFYVMFILLEYRFFKDKLNLMITDKLKKKEIFEILEKIKTDIKSYFVIKTIVSFITALASYLIMSVFNLDFAIFWAFLVFILNFIPSIWSIIAVTFPFLFSMIQFESYYPVLFMASWLVWTQVLMWNIIEPKFMWNKLNLSPLVIIMALWFWWSLWWVVGMLLSVPITVIINIVFSKIPATRPLAILLSEKWELQIHNEQEVKETRKNVMNKIKNKIKRKNKK